MSKRASYGGSDDPSKRARTTPGQGGGRGSQPYAQWQQQQGQPYRGGFVNAYGATNGQRTSAYMPREIMNYVEVVWPEGTRASKPACYIWYHLALAIAMLPPDEWEYHRVEGLLATRVAHLVRNFWDAAVVQLYFHGNYHFDDLERLQQLVKHGKCFKIHPVRSSKPSLETWSVSLDKVVLQRWYAARMAITVWPKWREDMEHFCNFKLAALLVSDRHLQVQTDSGKFSMEVDQLETPMLSAWSSGSHRIKDNPPDWTGADFVKLLRKRPACFFIHEVNRNGQIKQALGLDIMKLRSLYDPITKGWPCRVLLPAQEKYRRAASSRPGDLQALALGFRPSRGIPNVTPSLEVFLTEWVAEDNTQVDAEAGQKAAREFGDAAAAQALADAEDEANRATEEPAEFKPDKFVDLDANIMVGEADNQLPVVLVEQASTREWKSMCSHLYHVARSSGPRCVGIQALQEEHKDTITLLVLIVPEEHIPESDDRDEDNNPLSTLHAPATVYIVGLAGLTTVSPGAVAVLRRLLEEDTIALVVHGSKSWSGSLAALHGFKLNNLIDLQVFHGWLTLMQQLSTSESFPEDRLSLNRAPLVELARHYRSCSTFLETWRAPYYLQRDSRWGKWPPTEQALNEAASFVTPLLELFCMVTYEYHKCSTIKALTRADTLHAHLQLANLPPLAHGQPPLEALRSTPPTTAAFLAAAKSFAICPDGDRPPFVQLDLHFNEKCEAVVTLGTARRAAGPDRKTDLKTPPAPAPAGTSAEPSVATASQPGAAPSTATASQPTPAPSTSAPSQAAAAQPVAAAAAGAAAAGASAAPAAANGADAAPAQNGPIPSQAPTSAPDADGAVENAAVKPEPQEAAPITAAPITAANVDAEVIDLLDSDDEGPAAAPAAPSATAAEAAEEAGGEAAPALPNGVAEPTATGTGLGVPETATATANGSVAPAENGVVDTIDILEDVDMDPDAENMLKLIPDKVADLIPRSWLQRGADPSLVEVMIDDGRPVQVKLSGDASFEVLPIEIDIHEAVDHLWEVFVKERKTSSRDLPANPDMVEKAKILFRKENRLTYDRSLHRISAIRDDYDGTVIGLTYRIGRHVPGVAKILTDVLYTMTKTHDDVASESLEFGKSLPPRNTSLLLVGKPGSGKTTMLRDIAYAMANRFRRNTVVVDTSNEIAGDGRRPHPCIGNARRVSVLDRAMQHQVMLQTVQNHTPHVLMLDELGQEEDVKAAIEVSKRGVMMIATVHGNSMKSIIQNPELNPLLGGWHVVTLGDITARHNNQGRKSRVEREYAPAFGVVVEVLSRNRFRVHPDAAASVDAILNNQTPPSHIRCYDTDGTMTVELDCPAAATHFLPPQYAPDPLLPSLKKQISMLQQSSWLLELLRVNFLAKLMAAGQVEEETMAGPGGTFRIGDPAMLDVDLQRQQAEGRRANGGANTA